MKRVLFVIATALVAVFVSAGVASATHSDGSGPSFDFVAGTGEVQTQLPTGLIAVKLHVNAMSGPSGENAIGHVHFKGNPPPIGELEFHGRVTCLRVAGNRATVGLVVTHAMSGPIPEGFGGLFSITDGGHVEVDAFEGFPVPVPPPVCPPPFPGRQIAQGNFVVHDAP